MKVCVFGAGALGGFIAACLARDGRHDISAVMRGRRLAEVQEKGLICEIRDGLSWETAVRTSADGADLGPQDIVFVTLKAPAIPGAVDSIKSLLGPDTTVVFVMNGVPWWYYHKHGGAQEGRRFELLDPSGRIWDTIGPHRVLGGVAHCSTAIRPDGFIYIDYPDFHFEIGEPASPTSERLSGVVRMMNDAALNASAAVNIRQCIWAKLALNMATGPNTVLTQCSLRDMCAQPGVLDAVERMIGESISIARAAGVELDIDIKAAAARLSKSAHKPSILQDLEAGRPMEIDGLYRIPLGIGRSLGIATPTLDLTIGLAILRARAAGLYPPWPTVTEPYEVAEKV